MGEQSRKRELEHQIDSLIETLVKDVKRGDLDDDAAQAYADCFGRTLARTVRATLTFEVEVTVVLPIGVEPDDFEDDLDIDITPAGWGSDIEVIEYDIFSRSIDGYEVVND